jgi:hypothetical protein
MHQDVIQASGRPCGKIAFLVDTCIRSDIWSPYRLQASLLGFCLFSLGCDGFFVGDRLTLAVIFTKKSGDPPWYTSLSEDQFVFPNLRDAGDLQLVLGFYSAILLTYICYN